LYKLTIKCLTSSIFNSKLQPYRRTPCSCIMKTFYSVVFENNIRNAGLHKCILRKCRAGNFWRLQRYIYVRRYNYRMKAFEVKRLWQEEIYYVMIIISILKFIETIILFFIIWSISHSILTFKHSKYCIKNHCSIWNFGKLNQDF